MLKLLLLATAITAACAKEEKAAAPAFFKPELNLAESAIPVMMDDDRHRDFRDGLQLNRYREHRMGANHDMSHDHDYDFDDHKREDDDHDIYGPVILRTINRHSHRHPDIELQNKIIADVYSPDYYQPTWILDYRYQKTGGRDYTRGPGGQILILPRNVRSKERKEFDNFDSLLEHLRLSRLSEQSHRRRGPGHEDAFSGYKQMDHGRHEYSRGHSNPYH